MPIQKLKDAVATFGKDVANGHQLNTWDIVEAIDGLLNEESLDKARGNIADILSVFRDNSDVLTTTNMLAGRQSGPTADKAFFYVTLFIESSQDPEFLRRDGEFDNFFGHGNVISNEALSAIRSFYTYRSDSPEAPAEKKAAPKPEEKKKTAPVKKKQEPAKGKVEPKENDKEKGSW